MDHDAALSTVRDLCLELPEVTERLSHGTPTWFVQGKQTFVTFWDDHHSDGRLCIWCAAPPGVQEAMVARDDERFFRPPYVGHRGWLGVRFDRGAIDRDELADIVEEAYRQVASKRLIARLDSATD